MGKYSVHRIDATQPEIFRTLRQVGALVLPLGKFDALVYYRGQLTMLDCKSKGGKPTEKQQRLLEAGWPLKFVQTPEEGLRAIGALR